MSDLDIYSVTATTDFSFMPFQTGKENEEKETDQTELLSVVLLRLRVGDKFFPIIRRLRTSVYDFTVYQLSFLHFWHKPVKIQSIIVDDNNNYSGGSDLAIPKTIFQSRVRYDR